MNNVEKQKNGSEEIKNKLNLDAIKKTEQDNILKENNKEMSKLAETVVLDPIKKGLDSLKNQINPKENNVEAGEKSFVSTEKKQDQNNVLIDSKKDLKSLKNNISPSYYADYAKLGQSQKDRVESVNKFYEDIKEKDPNPVVDLLRRGAEFLLS